MVNINKYGELMFDLAHLGAIYYLIEKDFLKLWLGAMSQVLCKNYINLGV